MDDTFTRLEQEPTTAKTQPALLGPEILLERGATVGRYVVLERAGAGGMGVVYSAYDPELDRRVALKLLKTDGAGSSDSTHGRARLAREAQAMARLSHPNVLAVHDVGTFRDQVFVAMEFVEGETLGSWLRARARPWREVLEKFVAAGRGLAAAHASGLVHRDFKPDNVLLGADGAVRVADFGLARATSEVAFGDALPGTPARQPSQHALSTPLTQAGAVLGTPAYMAPEQHLGQNTDTRTDQFSFCVALYESLYGQHPFGIGSSPAMVAEILFGRVREPPKDSHVPARIRRALVRGLRPNPSDRYPSMDALLAELSRKGSPSWRRWGIAAAILFALGTLAAFPLRQDDGGACRADRKLVDEAPGAQAMESRLALHDTPERSANGGASDPPQKEERSPWPPEGARGLTPRGTGDTCVLHRLLRPGP